MADGQLAASKVGSQHATPLSLFGSQTGHPSESTTWAQHLPGEEVWVIGEHCSTGERKYYLSNLSAETSLKHPRRRNQGSLRLRTGPSVAERGTWPRPLRRTVMDRSSPACTDDHDRL